ncbi:MAG: hypothetical protein SOR38_03630 [Oscillospiraceae bacterium]|nr:hypothetical protein [Oscillospiraceae bacterium]MDY3064890.1 hypothetical protein [Oscillospiraceae bacterium]
MYFTNTPTLNSIEAIMKKLPYGSQRGGGRFRSPYKYTKKDCDCRLCLYYRKKTGCTATLCPVLDIRLSCGAASIGDAVKAIFKDTNNTAFQKRLSQIYNRKDDVPMIFQSNRHKQIFETERLHLRKPTKKALAVLYLLTADKALWQKTKSFLTNTGKVELNSVHLGDVSTDSYALWKAVKELQTGEKQISLCELADSNIVSDHAFRLIVQAVTIAHYGAVVFNNTEVRYD